MELPHALAVSLVTLGNPETMTGGYLYHRRVAQMAPEFGARVRFASFPDRPFPLGVLAARRVLREVQQQRPDVVLLDSIAAAFLGPTTAPAPVVAILHQPPGGIDHGGVRSAVQARLDRLAYRRASHLLAASQALADGLLAEGFPEQRVTVMAPGRDVAAVPARPPDDLRGGRRTALLCVGNWVMRKGQLELLDAVALLPPDAVTLHLVGATDVEPAYAARVRRRLADPRLRDRVVVHGAVSPAEVAAFYAGADVFALASTREPYGTVYGEAMAAGLPVVGWDAGNLPYLARDGVEGLAVRPGDVAGLADALRALADDEPRRRAMGEAAGRRASTFPTWHDTAGRLFSLLRRVATGTHER